MGKHWRRRSEGTPGRDAAFFAAPRAPAGGDPFFKPPGAAAGPAVALQPEDGTHATDEKKKDPLVDGLKAVGEHLADHEPLKKWGEPKLDKLKLTLWDHLSPAEKAAMLTFAGVNLGIGAAAFAGSPAMRSDLSGVNVGKPLGWIPYSPVSGFTYKLPEPGKTATGLSADFSLKPYIDLLHKRDPSFPVSGATFGLDSSYDPRAGGFRMTGGKFGLDLFGGGLKAEGKVFGDVGPASRYTTGLPGYPALQMPPGLANMPSGPGAQFMLSADLLKLFPSLRKNF